MEFTKVNFFNEIRKKSVNLPLIRKFKAFVDITETENDTYKETALHHACKKGLNVSNRVKLIQYLLENDLDPNSENSKGVTPFQLNLKNFDDPDIMRVFMRHFSDVGFVDQNGDHFFHYAQPNNFVYLFEAFYELGLSIRAARNNELDEETQTDFIDYDLIKAVETMNDDEEDPFEEKDFSEALLKIKNVDVMKFFTNRVKIGPLPIEAFENVTLLDIMKSSVNGNSFFENIKEEQLMRVFQSIDNPVLNTELLKVLSDKFGPPKKFYMEALKNERWETFYAGAEANTELLTGEIVQHIVKTTKDDKYILKILKLVDVSKVPKDKETGNNLLHHLVQDSSTKSLNYLEEEKNVVFRELSEQRNRSGKKPQEIIKVVREVVSEEILREQQKLKSERQILRQKLKLISRKTVELEEDNDDLEIEVRKRGETISDFEQKIGLKDKTIKEIDGLMKKHLQELEDMHKKFEEEKLKKKECDIDTSELEKKILERENLIKTQRAQLKSSKSRLEKESGIVVELKRKIQQESEMLSKQENSIDSLTGELSKLRSELDISKKGNAELKSKIEDNVKTCQTNLERALNENKEMIETIRQENSKKQLEQQKLHTKEINELKKKFKEDLSEAEEKKRSKFESIVDMYQRKDEELKKKLMEEKKKYEVRKNNFEIEVQRLMDQCRIDKMNTLREEKSTCEQRVNELNESQSSDQSQILKEKDALQKKMERINQEHTRRVIELDKKVKESERLLKDEKEKQKKLIEETLLKQKEECQKKLNRTEKDYERKVISLKGRFQNEMDRINDTNEKLVEQYSVCDVKYKELTQKRIEEIKALQKEVEITRNSKEEEVVKMKTEHEIKLQENKRRNEEIEKIHKKDLEERDLTNKQKIFEIEKEMEEKDRLNEEFERTHKKVVHELEESHKLELEKLDKKHVQKVKEVERKIQSLKQSLEGKINQLNEEIEKLKTKHEKEKNVLQKKFESEREAVRKKHEAEINEQRKKYKTKNDTLKLKNKEVLRFKKKEHETLISKIEEKYRKTIEEKDESIKQSETKLRLETEKLTKEKKEALQELSAKHQKTITIMKENFKKTEELAITNLTTIMKELPSVTSLDKLRTKIRGAIDVSKKYEDEPLSRYGDIKVKQTYEDFKKKLDERLEFVDPEKNKVILQKVVIERPTLSVILRERQKKNLKKLNAYFAQKGYADVFGVEKPKFDNVKEAYRKIIVGQEDMFIKRVKTEEPVESLKITTSNSEGKVYKGITTVNTHLYIDILTEYILDLFMNTGGKYVKETKSRVVAHHVYLFGRSGSGKTYFWTELVKIFVKKLFTNGKLNDVLKKNEMKLNYQIMTPEYFKRLSAKSVDDKSRVVLVSRVETIGHYAAKGAKQTSQPVNIRFSVLDERNKKKRSLRQYKTNFEKEKKTTPIPGIYHKYLNGEDFYTKVVLKNENRKKINWKYGGLKRKQNVGELITEENLRKSKFQYKYADFTDVNVVKDAIVDDRMEIKLKKPETGHYSTRNHIQKRVYIEMYKEAMVEKEFEEEVAEPSTKKKVVKKRKVKKTVKDLVLVKELQLTFVIFAGSEKMVTDKKFGDRKEEFSYFANTENLLPNVILKSTTHDSSVTKYEFIKKLIGELKNYKVEPTFSIMVWPAAEEILKEERYITQTKTIIEKITKKYQKSSKMLVSLAEMFV